MTKVKMNLTVEKNKPSSAKPNELKKESLRVREQKNVLLSNFMNICTVVS